MTTNERASLALKSRGALEESWRELSRQLELAENDLDSLPMQYEERLVNLTLQKDHEIEALKAKIESLTNEHRESIAYLTSKLEKLKYKNSVASPGIREVIPDDMTTRMSKEIEDLKAKAIIQESEYLSKVSKLEDRIKEVNRFSSRRRSPEETEVIRLKTELDEKVNEVQELEIRLRALEDAFETTRGYRYPGRGQPITVKSLQTMLNRSDTELIRRASKNAALQYEVTKLTEDLETVIIQKGY